MNIKLIESPILGMVDEKEAEFRVNTAAYREGVRKSRSGVNFRCFWQRHVFSRWRALSVCRRTAYSLRLRV